MTPQDLLKKTINSESLKIGSDFVEILHRGSTKLAKIEFGDFRKTSKSDLGDRDIQDEISFLNVSTIYVAKGDTVTFNSVAYTVEYFTLVTIGIYNIFATKKVRTGNMG